MKVVVAGAGIAGLTAALQLHARGVDCEIYEQGSRIGVLGVGINVLPHAVAELAAVGLLEHLDEVAVQPLELVYAHRLGPEILRRPCGTRAGFAVPQLSLHRGRLQAVLLRAVRERLGPDAVRTGHRLTTVEQDADGVRVRFADRDGRPLPAVRGDVLVGADGIHSATRALLYPDEGPPRWNGVQMWRGARDWPAFGDGHTVRIAGGTDAKLVLYPIGAGAEPGTRLTNWAVCIRTGRDGDPPPERQDWSRPAELAQFERHLDRFHVPELDHAGLVRATPERFEFPMCDRDPLPSWTRGRMTLLGDAAHPMYPMGSNGAGQAVLDATNLATQLAAHPDPAAALQAYDAQRRPATSEVVLRNRVGGPESVIDEVERRAPDGFNRLTDVIDPAELDAVVSGYTRASGGAAAR